MTKPIYFKFLKGQNMYILYLMGKVFHFSINHPIWLRGVTINDGLAIRLDDNQCESWRVIKFFGKPQYTFDTTSEHDCSGQTFCKYVHVYLFGLISVGYYGIDV